MRSLITLSLLLLLAAPVGAEPLFKIVRHDWFNLANDGSVEGPGPVGTSGGPQSVGAGLAYSWDIALGAGSIDSWMQQTAQTSTSLHTHREAQLTLRFDDVIFDDGAGGTGNITVRCRLAVEALVAASGSVASTLCIAGSGGAWGSWYAAANSSAPASTGVFTGLDGVNQLDSTFQSNAFTVSLGVPQTIEIRVEFGGTARKTSQLDQQLVAHLDPAQAFVLPAGVTVNSAQAGIVDNQWAPATTVGPLPVGTLALRAWPNPFAARATLSMELPAPGPVSAVIHDLRGRAVRSLFQADLPAGPAQLWWDGRGDDGQRLPAGRYFARVVAGAGSDVQSLSLLR